MIAYECDLIGSEYTTDSVGNNILQETRKTIPIQSIESVFASEFYQASSQGFKPSLRLKISSLNYAEQPEVEYLQKRYSIIRVDEIDNETIALVCERRLGI